MRAGDFRVRSTAIFIPLLPRDSSLTQGKALSPLSCSPVGETEALTHEGRAPCSQGSDALDLLPKLEDLGLGRKGEETPGSLRTSRPGLKREKAPIPALATRGRYELKNG